MGRLQVARLDIVIEGKLVETFNPRAKKTEVDIRWNGLVHATFCYQRHFKPLSYKIRRPFIHLKKHRYADSKRTYNLSVDLGYVSGLFHRRDFGQL